MRTFGSFTFDVVEKLFSLEEVTQLDLLDEWLGTTFSANDSITYVLNYLKEHLTHKANIWNEDEFKMFFIGPLIELANLETKNFQPFTQRTLSISHEGEEIGGRVDFLVAKGRRVPEQPYLCIHEYKQEADNSGDPLGQLLIAMVAAQKLNDNHIPILGAYVIGRNWFFVILHENKYIKSNSYNASKDEIFQIFAILQKSKDLMLRFITA